MASIPSHFPIPTIIRETLDQLRAIIARYVILQAVFLTAICGLSLFWLTGLIDYFPVWMGANESPNWARMMMLIAWLASMVWIFYQLGLKKWMVRWRDTSLALLLERRFPDRLRHALVTTVQAAELPRTEDGAEFPRDPLLLQATQQQAISAVQEIDLESVMHWRPLQWQAGILGAIVAFSLLMTIVNPSWTLHWTKRLLGLSNAAWPRMSRLHIEGIEFEIPRFTGEIDGRRYLRPFVNGSITVPRGQNGRFIATADLTAKKVPESCVISYRGSDSRQGRASLRRLNAQGSDRLPFVLEGPPMESIDQPFSLTLQGGDVRIAGLRLNVIDAPQLNELHLEVKYPEYLRRSQASRWLDESLTYRAGVRIPEGTSIALIGRANMPLDRCECRVTQQTRDGESVSEVLTAPGNDDGFRLPIGSIQSNILLEFRLWEASGHCATRVQQMVIGVLSDEVPDIDLVLSGIGSAITDQAVLPVEARVTDDHEVASSELQLFIDEQPPRRLPVTVARDGKVRYAADLRDLKNSGQLKLAAGQSLGLTLVAKDFCDLNEAERLARSSPIQLAVVTPNQLLVLLERRELAMRSRMELIISELDQLRELLVKMRENNRTPDASTSRPAGSDPPLEGENDALSRDKLQVLRAQQAASQSEKSEGELGGVESEIGQIRQELINNRMDSQDRQERLENRVRLPIHQVRTIAMAESIRQLRQLEKQLANGPVDEGEISAAIDSVGTILTALEAILQDMVDIQDFNELVDMVRSMIDDQDKLIDRTKTEQKKRVLDMFK